MRLMPWGSAHLCKELCYSASAVRIYTAFAHSVPEELEYVQVYPNNRALVVSTENITQNWYFGNNKAMLIPNCLFRVGGAALVLTNRRRERRRAK